MIEHAIQTQRLPPPSYRQDQVQGNELAAIRGRPASSWQPDRLADAAGTVVLAGTTTDNTRWPAALLRSAIETALTLGLVFGLRLRQTEGLLTSVLKLMGLDLAVSRSYDPEPSCEQAGRAGQAVWRSHPSEWSHPRPHRQHRFAGLRRRPMAGRKAWCQIRRGCANSTWRWMPTARHHRTCDDPSGGRDTSQVGPLLDQIDTPIVQFTADGAYDGEPTYDAVTRHSPDAAVVIPPRANALETRARRSQKSTKPTYRGDQRRWKNEVQIATNYGKRSLVETAIGRYKSIIGRRCGRAHSRHSRRRSHQLRRPQSNAGMRTPEIRPVQNRYRIATAS